MIVRNNNKKMKTSEEIHKTSTKTEKQITMAQSKNTGTETDEIMKTLSNLLLKLDEETAILVCNIFESLDIEGSTNSAKSKDIFLRQKIPEFLKILKIPSPSSIIRKIGFIVSRVCTTDCFKRIFKFPYLPAYFVSNTFSRPRMYIRILHNNNEPFTIRPLKDEIRNGYFYIGQFCKLPQIQKDAEIKKLTNMNGNVKVNGEEIEPFEIKGEYYFLCSKNSQSDPFEITINQVPVEGSISLFQWFILSSCSMSDGFKIMIQHSGTPYNCCVSVSDILNMPKHICPKCNTLYTKDEICFVENPDYHPQTPSTVCTTCVATHTPIAQQQEQSTYEVNEQLNEQNDYRFEDDFDDMFGNNLNDF